MYKFPCFLYVKRKILVVWKRGFKIKLVSVSCKNFVVKKMSVVKYCLHLEAG